MLRSLFTGISGLRAHQQMLDITANNIANVNTVGYKSSSSEFEDTLSQQLTGATQSVPGSASAALSGSTNPNQIGLGVAFAGTAINFTEGSAQATGVKTNMMINGDGFFTVKKDGADYYTRNGDFSTSDVGNLVTPDGAILQGWMNTVSLATTPPTVTPPTLNGANLTNLDLSSVGAGQTYSSFSISSRGEVNGVVASGPNAGSSVILGVIAMGNFSNPAGLTKNGNSLYLASNASGVPTYTAPASTQISTGYVEMSNVDLSTELTNLIVSERGFQANSKVITTSDEILQTLVDLKR
jgi:flagellar hook protein FlgE